jgi:hypothetical protein
VTTGGAGNETDQVLLLRNKMRKNNNKNKQVKTGKIKNK